ncbi:MAG: pyruvate dehydrogenase (acetyl-transferring) E1 component subunit alpha [Pseudomonadales bacterium]|nr:pyruvate dehydrogenase (acetyl-transferring) E1 component subunit alpha [Pseudomonadales bacterium]
MNNTDRNPELRAQFEINYYQYLDNEGKELSDLPAYLEDEASLITLYKSMVLTRLLDKKCIALQRTGKMGTYPSTLGQEAIGVAVGHAMKQNDVLAPYYRDMAAQLIRGVEIKEILLSWGGDERGNNNSKSPQDLPNCVPIATQVTHGAGIATAIKSRHENRAVVTTLGDGATSRGDFSEAVNLAGTWQLPLVIVINNNQWAISVPRSVQTAAQTLAQKGILGEVRCEQVDGCDMLAIYDAVKRALENAYSGKGPTLIEAITYRLSDHTTADDATRYSSPDALKKGWEKEPIKRFRNFLHHRKIWNEGKEKALYEQCEEQIKKGVEDYLNTETQPPEAMFDYLYKELPHSLYEQREQLINKTKGDDHE